MTTTSRHSRKALIAAAAVAFLLSAVPQPAATAQEGGGKNVVIAYNQTNGRAMDRSGLALTRSSGPSAVPENLAKATSSCTDCRTVAAAMQVVLIMSDADWIEPHNAAVAANVDCTRCQTMAYAYQYVVTTQGVVTVSAEGEAAIAAIRNELAAVAASDLPFPELAAEFDALAAEFRATVDEHITRPGNGTGRGARDLDTQESPQTC